MILSGVTLTDTILHQSGQRRQNIDRRINCLAVKLTVQNDLTLGDVSGQVRDRVGDIVVGHGQNRDLGYRTVHTLHDTGALIKSSQFTVQITRITFSGRNLSFGGGNLTHGLGERSHIGKNYQDMHAFLKSKVLSGSQRYLRSDQSLNYRIVCQVQIHDNVVGNAALLEGLAEEVCHIVFNAHSRENNSEFLIGSRVSQGSLFYDLSCQTVMGKSVSGEDRQLLTSDQSSQSVDGGNTGTDIVSRVLTGYRVQRQTVDIQTALCLDLSQSVDGLSDTVEGTSQDIRGKSHLHGVSGEFCMGIFQGHSVISFKHLDNSLVLVKLDDTAKLFLIAVYRDLYDLLKGGVLNAFENYQGAVDLTES